MTETMIVQRRTSGKMIGEAVHRNRALSCEGVWERAFTVAFSGLVYPQIWEDPEVDLEALQLHSDCRVLAIASGGCNVLSYLTHSPRHITAVDLNTAHIALNRLKLAALKNLPDYNAFYRFFGHANDAENIAAFDLHIKTQLDADTHDFWTQKNIRGRRRIDRFAHNFYRTGLLGRFIGTCHRLARLMGGDPSRLVTAETMEQQRQIFSEELQPLFQRRLVRWLLNKPASLFGLGIPPAQYHALASDHEDGIAGAIYERLERLACSYPLSQNYFAWQAFGRCYEPGGQGALPPYLQADNYDLVRRNCDRVDVRHTSYVTFLKGTPDVSLDRYILLDAQDWMDDEALQVLWSEITRTAKPGARVIFRTAAAPSLLPGRVRKDILDRWDYCEQQSRALTQKDRSAIYGGFHLYVLR